MARCLTTIMAAWCGVAAISSPRPTPISGRKSAIRQSGYAGNNLACGDCHLEAGTKKFGLPIFGLYDEFPKYSARAGAEITIEERVNSCMTRSMNGRAMPHRMRAADAGILESTSVRPDRRAGNAEREVRQHERANAYSEIVNRKRQNDQMRGQETQEHCDPLRKCMPDWSERDR